MRRALLYVIPASVILAGLALFYTARASADVVVSVTPDQATAQAGAANGYTLTASGSAGTPLDRVRFLIPSHGRPCGYPDTTGTPKVGSDTTTNFVVTDAAGGVVTGRWITWLGLAAPVSLHISVLMPPLGGCFYSGATADAAAPVMGLKRGASIFNGQASTLATGGNADATGSLVTVTWWMRNGSTSDITLASERLGASDGFAYQSSTFATTPRPAKRGVSWSWGEPLVIPAGQSIHRSVVLTRQCGAGWVNLRARITLPDGTTAGTGNGINVAPC